MNDRRKFNKYIVFWLTQSLSELGSSMTSFALVIWLTDRPALPCLYLL